MTKIALEIDSCKECPFFNRERYYTFDSWELAYDWFCKKEKDDDGKDMKISGYVGWNEEKDVKIPAWCPTKVEE